MEIFSGQTRLSSLKILSWNIHMLPCAWFKDNMGRATAIAQQLKEKDYDILVFEEAFDFFARKIIKNELRTMYPYNYGPANSSLFSLRINSGIWILSRMPLRKLHEIKYDRYNGFDSLARKGAVILEGEWNHQPFQLIGTHLQSDKSDEIRRRQCQSIATKLLLPHTRENVPQLICGDFNIESDDPKNYHFMLKILEAEDGDIQGDVIVSYDEVDNILAKKNQGKKLLIDYILVRNSHIISNIQRRISIFRQLKNNIVYELSDHYAVEAVINFHPLR